MSVVSGGYRLIWCRVAVALALTLVAPPLWVADAGDRGVVSSFTNSGERKAKHPSRERRLFRSRRGLLRVNRQVQRHRRSVHWPTRSARVLGTLGSALMLTVVSSHMAVGETLPMPRERERPAARQTVPTVIGAHTVFVSTQEAPEGTTPTPAVQMSDQDRLVYGGGSLYNAGQSAATLEPYVVRNVMTNIARRKNPKMSADALRAFADGTANAWKHRDNAATFQKMINDQLRKVELSVDVGTSGRGANITLLKLTGSDIEAGIKWVESFFGKRPAREASKELGQTLTGRPVAKWVDGQSYKDLSQIVDENLSDPTAREALSPYLAELNGGVGPDQSIEEFGAKNRDAMQSINVRLAAKYGAEANKTAKLNARQLKSMRQEIAQFLTEKRKLAKKAEERRKKEEDLQANIAAAENLDAHLMIGRQAVQTLLLFDRDNKDLQAFAAISNATMDLISVGDKISRGLLQPPASFTGPYGIVLNLAGTLMSLYSDQKSVDQMILEEVQALRTQVHNLQVEMRQEFSDLGADLERMETQIAERFDHIERLLTNNFAALRADVRYQNYSHRLAIDSIYASRRAERRYIQALANREPQKAAELLRLPNPGRHFVPSMTDLQLGARFYAADELFVGATGLEGVKRARFDLNRERDRLTLGLELARRLKHGAPEYDLRLLFDALEAVGVGELAVERPPAPRDQPSFINAFAISNPDMWNRYARNYLTFAQMHHDLYGDYDPNLKILGCVYEEGQRARVAITNLLPLDQDGCPSMQKLMALQRYHTLMIVDAVNSFGPIADRLHMPEGLLEGYDAAMLNITNARPLPKTRRLVMGDLFTDRYQIRRASFFTPTRDMGEDKEPQKIPLNDLSTNPIKHEKYVDLIPPIYQIARDLLGGTIDFCYENCGTVRAKDKENNETGNHRLAIDLSATYKEKDANGQLVAEYPIFRRRVLGHEVPHEEGNNREAEAVALWLHRDSNRISALEEKFLAHSAQKPHPDVSELLDEEQRAVTSARVEMKLMSRFAQAIEQASTEVLGAAGAGAGKQGDAIHAVEGSKKLFACTFGLCFREVLESDTQLAKLIAALPGETTILVDVAQNKGQYTDRRNYPAIVGRLLQPSRELVNYLVDPNSIRVKQRRIAYLDETLDAYRSYLLQEQQKRPNVVLPPSLRLTEGGGMVKYHTKSVVIGCVILALGGTVPLPSSASERYSTKTVRPPTKARRSPLRPVRITAATFVMAMAASLSHSAVAQQAQAPTDGTVAEAAAKSEGMQGRAIVAKSSREQNLLYQYLFSDPQGPKYTAKDTQRTIDGYQRREADKYPNGRIPEARWKEIRTKELPTRVALAKDVQARLDKTIRDKNSTFAAIKQALKEHRLTPAQCRQLGWPSAKITAYDVLSVDPFSFNRIKELAKRPRKKRKITEYETLGDLLPDIYDAGLLDTTAGLPFGKSRSRESRLRDIGQVFPGLSRHLDATPSPNYQEPDDKYNATRKGREDKLTSDVRQRYFNLHGKKELPDSLLLRIFTASPDVYLEEAADPDVILVAKRSELEKLRVLPAFFDVTASDLKKAGSFNPSPIPVKNRKEDGVIRCPSHFSFKRDDFLLEVFKQGDNYFNIATAKQFGLELRTERSDGFLGHTELTEWHVRPTPTVPDALVPGSLVDNLMEAKLVLEHKHGPALTRIYNLTWKPDMIKAYENRCRRCVKQINDLLAPYGFNNILEVKP